MPREQAKVPQKTHRGLAGMVTSAGAGVANMVAGVVLVPIIIGTVGAGPYGVWLVISAVAQYMNYSDLGVGTAIVHFGSRVRVGAEERTAGEFLSAGLVWNAFALCVILPVYFVIAVTYLHSGRALLLSPSGGAALMVVGSIMMLSLLLKPFGSALVGAGMFPVDRRNQLVGVLVRIGVTLVGCLLMRSVVLVAAAETLGVLLPALLSAVRALRLQIAPLEWHGIPLGTLRYMLSYSVRSFAVNVVGALLLQSGTVIAGFTLSSDSVTYYNAAFRVYSSIRQLIGWMNDPFRPALSRLYAIDPEHARRTLLAICFVTFVASTIGCGFIIFAAHTITRVWLGTAVPVSEIAVTMTILLCGLVLNAIHLPFVPAGDAFGKPGVFFRPQLIWLVLAVLLSVWLAPQLGMRGIALGFTVPLVVVEPMYLLMAGRALGVGRGDWFARVLLPAARIVGGGLALACVVWVAHVGVEMPASGLLYGVVFLVGSACAGLFLRRRIPWGSFQTVGRLRL